MPGARKNGSSGIHFISDMRFGAYYWSSEIMVEMESLRKELREMERYREAARLVQLDIETVCPSGGMEEEAEIAAFLEKKEYLLRREAGYEKDVLSLHEKYDELSELEKILSDTVYDRYLKEKNISPEKAHEFSLVEKKAYMNWRKAYDESDFGLFKESLSEVIKNKKEKSSLRILSPDEEGSFDSIYDMVLDENEKGFRVRQLDKIFNDCFAGVSDIKDRILKSDKKIRTDFLSRKVPDEIQRKTAEYIADVLGFDREKGSLIIAKHAFSDRISRYNVRITTYFDPALFTSNIFSVLHETGHALFELLQPEENFEYYISDNKTQGMHEAVARFFENIIGRSEGFIHYIYPALKELMPEALSDVSERELYEAVNYVSPSFIRTDADEVTYSLHIIIRYELEKKLFSGELKIDDLPEEWNRLYEKYLGIRPGNDREGVLQDVHWSSSFGYFPTYLLGNIYSAAFYSMLQKDTDVDSVLRNGKRNEITGWLKERVFYKADRLAPAEWIKDITGKELSASDYVSYLDRKYSLIYGI